MATIVGAGEPTMPLKVKRKVTVPVGRSGIWAILVVCCEVLGECTTTIRIKMNMRVAHNAG